MAQKEKSKEQKSKVDILLEEIDEILIKNGLKPTVYGKPRKGSFVYFPKQKKNLKNTN